MQFTEETNKRQQIHNQEFLEYAAHYHGLVSDHHLSHNFMAHKIAELELKIEKLTQTPYEKINNYITDADKPMD